MIVSFCAMAGHSRLKNGVASLAYARHPRLTCSKKQRIVLPATAPTEGTSIGSSQRDDF
jgi:hypothetical protein